MTTASKSAVTVVAAAMAAVLCTQMAYAAGPASVITPTAVWSRNLGQSYTIDGKTYAFKINPGTGTINQDGTLTVANAWTGYPAPYINISADGATSVSVLVKFSGLSLPVASNYGVCIADMADSDGNEVGAFIAQNASRLSAFYMTAAVRAPTQVGLNGSDNAVVESGYMLYSYSTTDGIKIYMGSSIGSLIGGQENGYKFSNRTISKVSIGGDAQGKYYDPCGFTIEEVALFVNEFYTADDVASYEFPAKIYSSDVNVSTINTDHPDETEIDVYLADGVTVTGDTTFTATKVNFHCYGSFNMTPPANNEATFDFSGVTGRPVITYSAWPAVSGTKFTSTVVPSFVTDSAQWTGVIYIASATVTDFTSNAYGNESSVVRLGNVSGWLRAPGNYAFTNTVPVELVGTLTINDGNSASGTAPNKCTVFKKVSGGGTINTDSKAPGVVIVIQDASEFTGSLGLNYGKYIVFGEAMPDYATLTNTNVGTIFVMPGATVTNNGFWWATGGKVIVGGELRASDLSKFGGGTYIETTDTGVFTLVSNGNGDEAETNTDYARITGTGALKYEGSGWRALSVNNFPTNMTLINERQNDILLSRALTYTIGSLAGTKNFQGNYGNGNRYLRILQAKDTEWSGLNNPDAYSRLAGFIVAPGASTAGTLTLSGKQTQRATLTVESGAKVNLTGTWVGATTVAGTLGGKGAITGDLTLSDGATLKVNDINDTLDVTGALTASSGTVTVDLPAGTSTQSGVKIISATGTITTGAKFKVTIDGEKTSLRVIKKSGFLKAVLPGLKIILR